VGRQVALTLESFLTSSTGKGSLERVTADEGMILKNPWTMEPLRTSRTFEFTAVLWIRVVVVLDVLLQGTWKKVGSNCRIVLIQN